MMKKKIIAIFLSLFWQKFSYANLSNKKIKSEEGRKLVSALLEAIPQKDTTSSRVETKAIILKTKLDKIMTKLERNDNKSNFFNIFRGKPKSNALILENRDFSPNKSNKKNGTFTFYGKGVYFMNLGIRTKLKLRARFYFDIDPNGTKRGKATNDQCFLEIKVKDPEPEQENSVKKLRINLKDKDLAFLYTLDPESKDFKKNIIALENRAMLYNKNKSAEVQAIFYLIAKISKEATNFIRPIFAISYTRTAQKIAEKEYKYKRFAKKTKKFKDIEYQLTYDQDILGYLPKKDVATFQDYSEYITSLSRFDMVYTFPKEAVSLEIKIPTIVANLKKKSPTHKKITRVVLDEIKKSENIVPGFKNGKGKIGQFKSKLKESAEFVHLFKKNKK